MKYLYGTTDLEAELFSENIMTEEEFQEENYDISEEAAETMLLEDLSPESLDDFSALELTLELADGRSLEYETFGVFVHENKEYVALHPKTDMEGTIHLMELTSSENDEIELLPIEDDEEYEAVAAAFYQVFEA